MTKSVKSASTSSGSRAAGPGLVPVSSFTLTRRITRPRGSSDRATVCTAARFFRHHCPGFHDSPALRSASTARFFDPSLRSGSSIQLFSPALQPSSSVQLFSPPHLLPRPSGCPSRCPPGCPSGCPGRRAGCFNSPILRPALAACLCGLPLRPAFSVRLFGPPHPGYLDRSWNVTLHSAARGPGRRRQHTVPAPPSHRTFQPFAPPGSRSVQRPESVEVRHRQP